MVFAIWLAMYGSGVLTGLMSISTPKVLEIIRYLKNLRTIYGIGIIWHVEGLGTMSLIDVGVLLDWFKSQLRLVATLDSGVSKMLNEIVSAIVGPFSLMEQHEMSVKLHNLVHWEGLFCSDN